MQQLLQMENSIQVCTRAASEKAIENQRQLLNHLEEKLEDALVKNTALQEQIVRASLATDRTQQQSRSPARQRNEIPSTGSEGLAANDATHGFRGAELEKMQKVIVTQWLSVCCCVWASHLVLKNVLLPQDQTILSLKAMLERHEMISEEKMKLMRAKYDQVKAINIALQVLFSPASIRFHCVHSRDRIFYHRSGYLVC
jgi:hypothetical protein